MAAPRWRGSSALVEQTDSPTWHKTNSGQECVRVYRGPYATALAAQPKIGATFRDMPANWAVSDVLVGKKRGGHGLLTVTLLCNPESVETKDAVSVPEFEIEWTQLEKPLLQHPMFADAAARTYRMGAAARAAVLAWENADPTHRAAEMYEDAGTWKNLGDLAEGAAGAVKYAQKRLNGTESYQLFVPVVRRTREYREPPLSSSASLVYTPAQVKGVLGVAIPVSMRISIGGGASAAIDLSYLKTADRATKSGKAGRWQRIEEWTAAEEWDSDLYPGWPGGSV